VVLIQQLLRLSLGLATLVGAGSGKLSGKVTDRAGLGIADINVSLNSSEFTASTDAEGNWALSVTGMVARPAAAPSFRWTGRSVEMNLATSSMVSVEAFDQKGASVGNMPARQVDAGERSLSFHPKSAGLFFLRVTVNGRSELAMIGIGRTYALQSAVASHGAARTLASIPDTIHLARAGKLLALIPVTNPDTSGIIANIDTSTAIPWNDAISTYGTLYDVRDGRVYRTVKIGSQTWMAENLNYGTDSSWWYIGKDTSLPNADSIDESRTGGQKYGRYYKWTTVTGMDDSCTTRFCILPDSCMGKSCLGFDGPVRRGVCPIGWHVPRDTEWVAFVSGVEGDPRVGKGYGGRVLKAVTGWVGEPQSGLDLFGFRALPAGYWFSDSGRSLFAGQSCVLWSASEISTGNAIDRYIGYGDYGVTRGASSKKGAYPVRCIKDD
jgi:uncharacterized protein (TIGR02145 family)